MPRLNPWIFGAVISITVVITYVVCTLFWFAFPEPSIKLINALFHGMDFRKIFASAPFSLRDFLYVLLVLSVWGYVVGVVYAVVRNLLLAGRKA